VRSAELLRKEEIVKRKANSERYYQGPFYERKEGGMVACPGEAHRNPYIDHCMVCLGHRWGFVPEYAPVNLEEAEREGLAVPYSMLSEAQDEQAFALIAAGRAEERDMLIRKKGYVDCYALGIVWKK
jgi:hypothetical protein